MALVAEQGSVLDHELIDAEIVGARVVDPKVVDGRIVDGRIVGGRLVDTPPSERSGRARRADIEYRQGEIVALVAFALVVLVACLVRF